MCSLKREGGKVCRCGFHILWTDAPSFDCFPSSMTIADFVWREVGKKYRQCGGAW